MRGIVEKEWRKKDGVWEGVGEGEERVGEALRENDEWR